MVRVTRSYIGQLKCKVMKNAPLGPWDKHEVIRFRCETATDIFGDHLVCLLRSRDSADPRKSM